MGNIQGAFCITDAKRAAKGRRWMRALQRKVAEAWAATTETDTSLCREHGMEVECEVVAISTAFALTATRVLDLEVFQAEHRDAYLGAKKSKREGQVVDGLVLIRNAEIHLPVILDPDVDRVLSLLTREGRSVYRVVPKWKPYDQLPVDVRSNKKTSERCHAAYRGVVEGESVIETLLDAISWFLECDSSLAHRDATGELTHFPLPELWQHDYERRHPSWTRRDSVESELRAKTAHELPGGEHRSIEYRLVDGDATIAFCGYTRRNGYRSAFTETPEQIARDIERGYTYLASTSDGTANLVVTLDHRLWVDGVPLDSVDFATLDDEPPTEEMWRGWYRQAVGNAFLYARERRGE